MIKGAYIKMQINKNKLHKISLITNVILALAVVVLVLNKMGFLTRPITIDKNSTVKPVVEWSYLNNPHYTAQLSSFELNNRDTDVIFAGDSITEYGPFDEYFHNTLILNRGIGGDVAEGLYARIAEILSHHPQKIFIMIGINDINRGITKEKSLEFYTKIINSIKHEVPNCEIYVESVLPVTKLVELDKIAQYNKSLKTLCESKNVRYIDLYSIFFKDGHVNEELLCEDGVHLNGNGYKIWVSVISNYVTK